MTRWNNSEDRVNFCRSILMKEYLNFCRSMNAEKKILKKRPQFTHQVIHKEIPCEDFLSNPSFLFKMKIPLFDSIYYVSSSKCDIVGNNALLDMKLIMLKNDKQVFIRDFE